MFPFFSITSTLWIKLSGIGIEVNYLLKIFLPVHRHSKLYDPYMLAVGLREMCPRVLKISGFGGFGSFFVFTYWHKGMRQCFL